ncbi:MAG: class I SAM-dependent methyltransferase [Candidatus Pacebacteria bacterium]|nr:class I SAM-dependent methyltransferase [Candidatus Paceibacterota bacterium]
MNTPKSNSKEWDYSNQAQYYSYRPNYDGSAINQLCMHVGAKKSVSDYVVADIGAGTGNLTIMLLERGLKCIAVEPNKSMREIGIKRTKGQDVEWKKGSGESSTLDNNSVDWFVMGSSFNTTNRSLTLKEAYRVLKAGGYFSCMWNHRDIENDPVQKKIEDIIVSFVPNYQRGVRREGQADIILSSGLFNDVNYIEKDQKVVRTIDEYIKAWMSVKNKYWDFGTEDGRSLFKKIADKIIKEFGAIKSFNLVYTTRIWTAKVNK